MPRPIVAVDLFSGAGGLSEGFLAAGIDVAVSVEKDPHAAFTHAFNHPKTTVLCDDICRLSGTILKREVKKRTGRNQIDIVAGGPPCQGFSSAGRRNARDRRNDLVSQFTRIVSECLPECFVFENVPNIMNIAGGKFVRDLLDDFWAMGYSIAGIDNSCAYYPEKLPIVNSSWFGVPQRRHRVVLVGWKRRPQDFDWIGFNEGGPASRRVQEVSVRNAIGDLAFLKGGFECHSYRERALTKYQRKRRVFSRGIFNHLASDHRPETVEMLKLFRQGKGVLSIPSDQRTGKQRRARLHASRLSHTVVGLQDDFIHYSKHRVPTVRELRKASIV